MSWRPEDDWARKVLNAYMVQAGWIPQNPAGALALVEYSADAMLEALKKEGVHYQNLKLGDTLHYNIVLPPELEKGETFDCWLAIIPEETKGG